MWPRDLNVLRYWGFKEEFKENQKLSHKDLIKAAKIASDKVFLSGMRDADPKIPGYKIYLSWKAVDLFGNGSIKPNENNI